MKILQTILAVILLIGLFAFGCGGIDPLLPVWEPPDMPYDFECPITDAIDGCIECHGN